MSPSRALRGAPSPMSTRARRSSWSDILPGSAVRALLAARVTCRWRLSCATSSARSCHDARRAPCSYCCNRWRRVEAMVSEEKRPRALIARITSLGKPRSANKCPSEGSAVYRLTAAARPEDTFCCKAACTCLIVGTRACKRSRRGSGSGSVQVAKLGRTA